MTAGPGGKLGSRKSGSGPGGTPGNRLGSRQGFTVLQGFAGRRTALPFVLLLLAVLGAGLLSVLVLNTAIDQGAFQLQQSQQRQTDLTNQEQRLQQQVAGLSAPAALASEAAGLGMVPNQQPAFLDPAGATVLGVPSVAPTPTAPPTTVPPTTAPATTASGTATPSTAPPTTTPPLTEATHTALVPGTATSVTNRATKPAAATTPDPSGSAR
jgi:hypothetical protein